MLWTSKPTRKPAANVTARRGTRFGTASVAALLEDNSVTSTRRPTPNGTPHPAPGTECPRQEVHVVVVVELTIPSKRAGSFPHLPDSHTVASPTFSAAMA